MPITTEKLIEERQRKESDKGSFLLLIFVALFVVMAAMFIGNMLFGKNSLEVYLALKNDKDILNKKIYHLKNENAALQKKYFELKNLMPNKDDE